MFTNFTPLGPLQFTLLSFALESLLILGENTFMSKFNHAIKRFFDICAVLAFSPLAILIIAVISLLLRLSSGPGVFFIQQRAGKDMRPFNLFKFRTMKPGIDPFGPSPKNGRDERFTRIGRWLRTLSLDELPQLWNILIGDMSLVGPRPLYMEQAQQWNPHQRQRLLVKPGLTGLAQIKGRGSLTIEEKLDLDVQYVEKQSLLFDMRIILTTLPNLLLSRDIYEKRYSRSEETRKPLH